ncbi:hypothetical protein K1X84_10135 [bacterium]|nr:hypothetical protein [bacterium]
MKLLEWIIVFVVIYPSGLLRSQSVKPEFDRFGLQDGLSQITVFTMIQDRYGFLWIGTEDGLNQYNGYEFKIFRNIPGDSLSLSHNHIRALFEDSKGMLWIGTRGGGLNRYDRTTGRFVCYRNDPGDPTSIDNNSIRAIFEDRNRRLWVGTSSGLNLLDSATGKFKRYSFEAPPSLGVTNPAVSSIIQDKNGMIWVGTIRGGLVRFDPTTENFKYYRHDPEKPSGLIHDLITALEIDHNGFLWIATYGGLDRYDEISDSFIHWIPDRDNPGSLQSERLFSLRADGFGRLWVGSLECLSVKYPGSDRFDHFSNESMNPHSLSDNTVWSILVDRAGTLWAGTHRGLNRWDPFLRKFPHITTGQDALTHNDVRAITIDSSGALWIGTSGGGINRFDQGYRSVFTSDPKNGLSNDYIMAMLSARNGTMWIATQNGLNRWDPVRGKFIRYLNDPNDPSSLSGNLLSSLAEDANGKLWVGTDAQGLNRLNEDGSWMRFESTENDSHSIISNHIHCLAADSSGNLWIGTNLGVARWNGGSFERWAFGPYMSENTKGPDVIALLVDERGWLWIGTLGNGLSCMDPKSGKWLTLTTDDGLSSMTIQSLTFVSNNIWAGTNNGLIHLSINDTTDFFSKRSVQIKNYFESDGIQSNEFNNAAVYRSASGELFFGGINGFNRFFPDSIRDNSYIPPVVFTSFKRFNLTYPLGTEPVLTKHIILSYADNVISFEFAALHFANPSRNQYAYMLEGFDESRASSGTRRSVTYTNLEPGEYVFHAWGSNSDGIWNNEGLAVRLTITPPWWETWWFRGIMIITIFSTLWTIYRTRVTQLLRIERLRTQIASDLHDDVGSSLSKIALYSELVQSGVNQMEGQSLLTEIGRMSRDIIGSMSDIVWSIDARNDTLIHLLTRMKEYALTSLPAGGMTVDLNAEIPTVDRTLKPEVRQNVYLIFKEVCNNILKHSHATHVHITVRPLQENLILTVSDNGVGFSPNVMSAGHGLRNIRARAERLHAALNMDGEPYGTRFSITVSL